MTAEQPHSHGQHSHGVSGMTGGDEGVPYNLSSVTSPFDAIDGVAPDGPIDEVFDHEAFDTQMDAAKLMADLMAAANPERAKQMSAYMRGQFPFLGIGAEERRRITRQFFKDARNDAHPDWSFVSAAWAFPQREFQYAAVDYLEAMVRTMSVADFPRLRTLIESKSWWDSVDALRKVVGLIAKAHPAEAKTVLLEWSGAENFWTRRAAIIAQLGWKDETDLELLGRILRANFRSDEFFINKAIGWALRDLSKSNPEWVREFIEKNRDSLVKLSITEASKYL